MSMPSMAQARLRVLLLARYGTIGASSRVRHYAYLALLKARGIDVEVDYLIDNESLARFYAGRRRRWGRIALAYARRLARLAALSQFDLIWIEKEALPGLPWMLERQFYNSLPTLVDHDDFWIARHEGNLASREAAKFRSLLGAATQVTVANSYLADTIEALAGRSPIVLTNSIDVDAYQLAGNYVDRSGNRDAATPARIGWIGTPFTAKAYLPQIIPALNRLTADGIAKMVLIGAGDAVPNLIAERIPWTIEWEAAAVAGIDIGIMPLDNNPFATAKSGWKLMQYMAAERPIVATRVGFNTELVDDGVTGFLVDTPSEFEQRLRELSLDPGRRNAMGAAARQAIKTRFNPEAHADQLNQIMRASVAGLA